MTDWRNRLADETDAISGRGAQNQLASRADPRAFISDIDKLGTYTPGPRESEHVEIGNPMPPWDEFMANLGMLLGRGSGPRGSDEEVLSRTNPPQKVREIMEAIRNQRVYPSDPMLPGPR